MVSLWPWFALSVTLFLASLVAAFIAATGIHSYRVEWLLEALQTLMVPALVATIVLGLALFGGDHGGGATEQQSPAPAQAEPDCNDYGLPKLC
jgi:hypothetical protein